MQFTSHLLQKKKKENAIFHGRVCVWSILLLLHDTRSCYHCFFFLLYLSFFCSQPQQNHVKKKKNPVFWDLIFASERVFLIRHSSWTSSLLSSLPSLLGYILRWAYPWMGRGSSHRAGSHDIHHSWAILRQTSFRFCCVAPSSCV